MPKVWLFTRERLDNPAVEFSINYCVINYITDESRKDLADQVKYQLWILTKILGKGGHGPPQSTGGKYCFVFLGCQATPRPPMSEPMRLCAFAPLLFYLRCFSQLCSPHCVARLCTALLSALHLSLLCICVWFRLGNLIHRVAFYVGTVAIEPADCNLNFNALKWARNDYCVGGSSFDTTVRAYFGRPWSLVAIPSYSSPAIPRRKQPFVLCYSDSTILHQAL